VANESPSQNCWIRSGPDWICASHSPEEPFQGYTKVANNSPVSTSALSTASTAI